ncbi:MAG: hypothetical protein FWH47_03930 [Methanomassiliicoccaceae archaeon]|nr:hypothetical protein [Methanomassiliicoccaceae archaeon]
MKTERRKNKAFLALFVVAALAMVSVAAVVVSDSSDAATRLDPMGNGVNSTTILENDDANLNVRFYLNLGAGQTYGVQFVTLREGVTVSGTISIGTADNINGDNYKEYATVELTGVSDAVFTLIMAPDPIYGYVGAILVGDEAKVDALAAVPDQITDYKTVKGSIEVTKGWLMGGAIRPDALTSAQWVAVMGGAGFTTNYESLMYGIAGLGDVAPFTGTFKAGSAEVSSAYAIGLAVGYADDRATVFGDVYVDETQLALIEDPDNPGTYICAADRADRVVTFKSGEFSVGFPENVSGTSAWFEAWNVDTVVESGATVRVGDNMPKTASNIVLEVDDADAVAGDVLYLIPEKGAAIMATGVQPVALGPVEFDFAGVVLNQEYRIAGSLNGLAYFATFRADGSGIDYSVSVGANEVQNALDVAATLAADPGSFIYDGANVLFDTTVVFSYSYVFAASGTTGILDVEVNSSSVVGKVKVDPTDTVFMVLVENLSGNQVLYIGDPPVAPWPDDMTANYIAAGASVPLVTFEEGSISLPSIRDRFSVHATTGDDYTLTVKGDIICVYTTANIRGLFENNTVAGGGTYATNFEGAGMLTYGHTPTANPAANFNPLASVADLNAAYYYVNVGTKPDSTTYYYTSIENALTNSNIINITGKVIIRYDTTLEGPNANADTLIRILSGATLQIGEKVYDSSGDLVEEYSPKVSIPTKTIVTRLSATLSTYKVESGQAIYDTKPTKAVETPDSDVLLEGNGKFIYTDIWTALDISTSGQTIQLRQQAAIDKDATLKAGVTMKDAKTTIKLIVDEDVIFTVNGDLILVNNTAGGTMINGTIRISGTAAFKDNGVATFGPNGAIDVMDTGVLTVGGDSKASNILAAAGDGLINVDGKLVVDSGSSVNADVISVGGEVSVSSTSTLTAITKLVIGNVPTLSPLSAAYTNTAKITGAVTLGNNGVAYVYGAFAITTSNLKVNGGTLQKTQYIVGDDSVYVTLYSGTPVAPDTDLVMVDDELLDIIFLNWWQSREFKAGIDWNVLGLNGAVAQPIGAFDKVYAEYKWRTFDATFSFTRGMDWVVNGVNIGSSATKTYNYGTALTIIGDVQPGYEGTPTLRADGASFSNPYTVTKNVTFTVTAGSVHAAGAAVVDTGGLTLIEILLIIIVIIIAVIAIIVAVRLLRS